MSVYTGLGAGIVALVLAGEPAAACTDPDSENPWHTAVQSRFPDLLACITPPGLQGKALTGIPAAYSEILAQTTDLTINDGCSIFVRTDSGRSAVYLEVVGGFSGNLQLFFGPFGPDPASF